MKKLSLKLEMLQRSENSLHFGFSIANITFSTSYWYEGVDLLTLEKTFGAEFMQRVYFHIGGFEINKLASLKPDVIDFGKYAKYQTPSFEQLWRKIFTNVWSQWRYENDLPFYSGPRFAQPSSAIQCNAVRVDEGDVSTLVFCGGGKDSLVSLRLLQRGGIRYDTLAYSSSIYGTAAHQHRLLDGLLNHVTPTRRWRQWIYDDFLDSPILTLREDFGVRTLTAAETPSSIFASLPLALQRGYTHIVLGHERSADTGQLQWEKTGEDVNHQWGKSLKAENTIAAYVRSELMENIQHFSLLKPIYDGLIFAMLRSNLDAVPATHSCNIEKPWCKRCPKCAYVWLGYMAFLPIEVVQASFGDDNLFDMEENQLTYRQLLGLEAQLPFECIGQEGETRLYFEICRRKGYSGKAMEAFKNEIDSVDLPALTDKYFTPDWTHSAIPKTIESAIRPQVDRAAEEVRHLLLEGG